MVVDVSDRPRVLIADPAWKFKDKLPGKRGAAHKYATMSPHEYLMRTIERNFDEGEIPDVLVLWRVAAMQREALEVIEAWGYEDPTSEIVWRKLTKHGKPAIQLGRTVRNAHEIALICKRKGTPGWKKLDVVRDHGVRSVLDVVLPDSIDCEAKLTAEHSEKPREFYELIDRLFHGPVVELFARRQWGDWMCFGNEMPEGHPGRVTL